MPPRRNPALEPRRDQIAWDFIGRFQPAPPPLRLPVAEPSPLVEALKQYLDSLP